MRIGGWARKHWKTSVNVVTIGALLVLIFAMRGQIIETFHNLDRVDLAFLFWLVPVVVLNYHAQAMVYKSLFRNFSTHIDYWQLLRLAVELNFVNHLFPSGGVAGISYFGVRLRQFHIGAGRATLVQTLRFLLLFIAFEPLLLAGVILLAAGGHISVTAILLCTVLTLLLLVGTALLVYVMGNKRRIQRAVDMLQHVLVWILGAMHLNYVTPKLVVIQQLLEEYHEDFLQIRADYWQLAWPFFWSLLANLAELGAIYLVYAAFEAFINPGAVIVAYAVANFAGLISIMPGGAGIYEGLMTVTLLAAGVAPAVSLPVTIMYRVLTMILQLPPGFFFYQQAVRAAGAKA